MVRFPGRSGLGEFLPSKPQTCSLRSGSVYCLRGSRQDKGILHEILPVPCFTGSQVCNVMACLLCTRAAAAAWHVPQPWSLSKGKSYRGECTGTARWPREGPCGRLRRIKAQSEEPTIGSVDSAAWPASQGLVCVSCSADASGFFLQLVCSWLVPQGQG